MIQINLLNNKLPPVLPKFKHIPKFTQRHYEDIAQLFNQIIKRRMYIVYSHEIMQLFIKHFEIDNKKFSRGKFIKAVLK